VTAPIQLPESRYVDIDGPVHYREWEGPASLTFVCVHGLGGSLLNWISIAPRLSERGRVIAVDLAGFGKTPREGRSSSVRANRLLLSRFVREAVDGRVILAGNSMGGAIVMLQAALEPDSVAGLVLTSPALPFARGTRPDPMVAMAFAAYQVPGVGERFMRERARRMGPERLVRETLKMCTVDPERVDPAVVDVMIEAATERQDVPDAIPAFLEAARSLLRLSRRTKFGHDVIDRITCPVLLIHGRHDRLVRVQSAIAAVERQPDWSLVIFEDAGHVAQLEDPKRWVQEVEGWLDQEPTSVHAASSR
jgi:pimeloyl-ACP methyl ester carboxylesterase